MRCCVLCASTLSWPHAVDHIGRSFPFVSFGPACLRCTRNSTAFSQVHLQGGSATGDTESFLLISTKHTHLPIDSRCFHWFVFTHGDKMSTSLLIKNNSNILYIIWVNNGLKKNARSVRMIAFSVFFYFTPSLSCSCFFFPLSSSSSLSYSLTLSSFALCSILLLCSKIVASNFCNLSAKYLQNSGKIFANFYELIFKENRNSCI